MTAAGWLVGEIVLAITGASGAVYGSRLLEVLRAAGREVRLIVSPAGAVNLELELGMTTEALAAAHGVVLESHGNVAARSASGSAPIDAVVICPCSGTTLAKVAVGIADNLVTRSAVVALKERRALIVVPRETPLATMQLQAMLTLGQMGAVVLPASPGFYHGASTVADLVDFVVARILDQLGVEHDLVPRWQGDEAHLG